MYSAKIDGTPTTFGTSGLLYRSNKLMYDRTTNSLWSSLTGVPVIGELARRNLKLDFFPVELTVWSEWLAAHPDTTVLSRTTRFYPPQFYQGEASPESIYFAYRAGTDTMFPVWDRDDSLETKDEVLGIADGDASKAYPVAALQEVRVLNDQVGGQEVVIIASGATPNARAYQRQGQGFRLPPNDVGVMGLPTTVVDEDGNTWSVTEDALTDDSGASLARIPTNIYFWFGWYAFHPDTELYEAP